MHIQGQKTLGTEPAMMRTMQVVTPYYKDTSSRENLWQQHRSLARYNHGRLDPQIPSENSWRDLEAELLHRAAELKMLDDERAHVASWAAEAPTDPDGFMAWFEELRDMGPGQNDPLFPWLAQHATLPEMIWFLKQEVAGEAGFEDLTALTQVKMPTRPKLEMARNYWDEMGRGNENGMHGPMLSRLASELKIKTTLNDIVPESLALANILVAFAMNRSYAYHSVGALGVVELTAPDRTYQVYLGLKRLKVSGEGQRYYLLHSTLDKKHSATWNREVIRPLVEKSPRIARAMAEGALMRLHAGTRCFTRYRQEFGI
jgi:hypothetical protein